MRPCAAQPSLLWYHSFWFYGQCSMARALQRKSDPRTKDRGDSTYEKNVIQRRMKVVQNALKSGYLKVLDAELILNSQERPGASDEEFKRLDQVLRISLPRWHIQSFDSAALSECTRLTICNLGSCYVRDITAFRSRASLLKLDLSNNQVSVERHCCLMRSIALLIMELCFGNHLCFRSSKFQMRHSGLRSQVFVCSICTGTPSATRNVHSGLAAAANCTC